MTSRDFTTHSCRLTILYQLVPMFFRQITGVRPMLVRQFGDKGPYTSRIILQARSNIHPHVVPPKGRLPILFAVAGVTGVGLGLSAVTKPQIHCDIDSSKQPTYSTTLPPPPTSAVNYYELSFGTLCGICTGIFIKKGAKAVAFLLGGVFVLLQYLRSASVIRIDWAKIGSRFEDLFYTKDLTTGNKKTPNVHSLWNWLVDFLTTNFQQRASFLAGLALGIRVG